MTTMSAEDFDRLTTDLFYAQKTDLVAQHIAEDFVDHDPLPGQPEGRDGTIWKIETFHAAFPDFKGQNTHVVVGDDKIVHEYRCEGTHQGEFLGMPATGRHVHMRGIDILQFRDGKIVARWGVFDTYGMMHQLGALGGDWS